jgi:hypothetical protein
MIIADRPLKWFRREIGYYSKIAGYAIEMMFYFLKENSFLGYISDHSIYSKHI